MNLIFKKIFYINLKHRKDRNEECVDFFKTNNILAERIEGVYHQNSAFGCTIAHINAIKKAKDENLDNVLVFEDDFKFENYDEEYIVNAFSELPEDWDIFYLGYNPTEKLIDYSKSLYKINGAWCLHAYAVNKKFYDVFLSNNIFGAPDIFIKNIQPKFNMFGLKENICIQKNNFSDIDGKFSNNGDTIKKEIQLYKIS